jgi:hypothetical protein
MKREFTFRTILVLAALFISAGMFAQTAIPGYSDGALGNNYDTTGTTYVTVGKAIPLFANPDPYYHPSYDPATGNNLTAGFTWSWTSTDEPTNITFGAAADNYVEVTGVNAGSYTVNVKENTPWGSCADAGRDITINVVGEPSIAYDGALSATYEDCEGGSFPAAVEAVISGGHQNFRLAWTLEIKTLTSGGADLEFYDFDKSSVLGTSGELAIEYTNASPQSVASSVANVDITTVAGTELFEVIDEKTTVYTYTLKGLNDQASRWSDFLSLAAGSGVNGVNDDDFTYYDTTDDVLTITVHPTPTTGPIFHIDANWAN